MRIVLADHVGTKSIAGLVGASVLLIVCTVLFFLYGTIDAQSSNYANWDLHSYLAMAAAAPSLPVQVSEPFCYRLLGPWLAGVLPGDLSRNFRFVTWATAFATILMVYLYFLESGAGVTTALCVACLCASNKYLFGFLLWDFYQLNDMICLFTVVLTFWALRRRNWWLAATAMAIGTASRETALMLIPAVVLARFARISLVRSLLGAVLVTIPALAVFVATRIAVRHPAGEFEYLSAFGEYGAKLLSPLVWARVTVNVWAPISLIPFVFAKSSWQYLRNRSGEVIFVVVVYISSLFGSNVERLVLPAFLPLMSLTADVVKHSSGGRNWYLVGLVLCGFLASLHQTFARFPLSSEQAMVGCTLSATIIATILSLVARQRYAQVLRRADESRT